MRHYNNLFWIGFFQLVFLSAGTYFIGKLNYPMIIISCYLTNMFFSVAINKLSFSSWTCRAIYSMGCTLGCVLGVWLASKL